MSVCPAPISEQALVLENHLSLLRALFLAPSDIGTDILRFTLCDTAVDCDVEFRAGLVAVNALFLKIDIDIQVTQKTDILEAVDGIAGEAADGFGQDEIDRPALTGLRIVILGREQLFVVEPCQNQILRGEVGNFPVQRLKAFRVIRRDRLQGFQLVGQCAE